LKLLSADINNMFRKLFVIAFTLLFYSCYSKEELKIEPISKEYNDRFLTLTGLDTSLFNTKELVQYYQVSSYENLPPEAFLTKLGDFTNARYLFNKRDGVNTLNIFFYKKRLFVDYSKDMYRSARDNENRTLEGYSDDLVALITYERLKDNKPATIFSKFFYASEEHDELELRDTIY